MRIRPARTTASGVALIPFHFNSAQQDYASKATNRDIILKRRRLGFSTLKLAEGLARAAFLGQRCGIISHNMRLTRQFLLVVGMMYDSIPSELRPEADRRNVDEIVFKKLGGSLTIGTARVDLFGRGDTFHSVHWSEVAHSPQPVDREIWLGISEAASGGDISWESTANGQAGLFYDEVWAAFQGVSDRFQLHFYPWWWGDDTRLEGATFAELGLLDEKEQYLVTTHGLDAARIAWRRSKRAELGPKFAQEYPESVPQAFIASGANYFDNEQLSAAYASVRKAVDVDDTGLHVWEKPLAGGRYVIGADIGGGGQSYVNDDGEEQSDYSAAAVINVLTGRVVATFRGKIKPEPFAALLLGWAKAYNEAFIVPERQGYGQQVVKILVEAGYANLYKEKTTENKWVYGWYTSASSRYTLMADFDESFRQYAITIEDERVLKEMMSFTSKVDALGRTRYQASPGQPDDLLFAHMIGWHNRDKIPLVRRPKPIIRPG